MNVPTIKYYKNVDSYEILKVYFVDDKVERADIVIGYYNNDCGQYGFHDAYFALSNHTHEDLVDEGYKLISESLVKLYQSYSDSNNEINNL